MAFMGVRMSKRTYLLWLAVWIVSVVVYGGVQIAANWQAPSWVNVPITLLGVVSLAQCCRWFLHRHRVYVAAKLSARAAADYARSHRR
jgi:hypothetical protein